MSEFIYKWVCVVLTFPGNQKYSEFVVFFLYKGNILGAGTWYAYRFDGLFDGVFFSIFFMVFSMAYSDGMVYVAVSM